MSRRRLRVAFLHPELGLGGAERLVVDAALELQARGHDVALFTAAHDPARAFPETCDGRLDVRLHGAFLPARIGGRLQAVCTAARNAWTTGALAAAGGAFDVVVADVVPWAMPIVRALRRVRVMPRRTQLVYYCHYPDQLLAPRGGVLHRAYRAPLDACEMLAMRAADLVLVNSRFTAQVLAGLSRIDARVLYPGVDIERHARIPDLHGDESTLLALGRFDRRKNVPLVLDALAALRERAPAAFARTTLVLAGGLDPQRPEDVAVMHTIEQQVQRLGLGAKVVLRTSPDEEERLELLARSLCVVHPACDEHFGLVPVEAMAAGRPVLAVSRAGPLETVVDGRTGWLREPTPDAFAGALAALLADPARTAAMGRAARAHARAHFSRRAFGDALEAALAQLVAGAPAT